MISTTGLQPVHGGAEGEPDKAVLADRRADQPVGEFFRDAFGRAGGAAAQTVHVFAEHEDAVVTRHVPQHGLGDGVDEFHLAQSARREVRDVAEALAGDFGKIAANADLDLVGVGPQRGRHPPPVAARLRLDHRIDGALDQGARPRGESRDLFLGYDAAGDELLRIDL